MQITTESLVANIQEALTAKNLRAAPILKVSDVSITTWWRWRHGKSEATLDAYNRIVAAIDAAEAIPVVEKAAE